MSKQSRKSESQKQFCFQSELAMLIGGEGTKFADLKIGKLFEAEYAGAVKMEKDDSTVYAFTNLKGISKEAKEAIGDRLVCINDYAVLRSLINGDDQFDPLQKGQVCELHYLGKKKSGRGTTFYDFDLLV